MVVMFLLNRNSDISMDNWSFSNTKFAAFSFRVKAKYAISCPLYCKYLIASCSCNSYIDCCLIEQ